jgi:hypothetical protein
MELSDEDNVPKDEHKKKRIRKVADTKMEPSQRPRRSTPQEKRIR